MRISSFCVLLACCAIASGSSKKKEDRGKRQLEYSLSNYHPPPEHYRLDRRPVPHPAYSPSQYFPGPPQPRYSTYRKDGPQNVDINNQLEDGIDRKGLGGKTTIIVPNKPLIIEKPVYKYIKEPEPIIEIIIKESNVTLPPEPTEAPTPPPKKKKEEVQVFYVKYKKNPNGYGKDSIVYDKPIPAISPEIPEEPEEEVQQPPEEHYEEEYPPVAPPPPTTTQRAIIKPDSEYYESPSGIKVTFGKEGFDYSKRSSKPEDYRPLEAANEPPQPRQLSSFSSAYFRRPGPPETRTPQGYRPFTFPDNNKPPPPVVSQAKYPFQPTAPAPSLAQFGNYQNQPPRGYFPQHQSRFQFNEPPRKPVPYKPFNNLKPQQSYVQPTQAHQHFRQETYFPVHQQLPLAQQSQQFNHQPTSHQHNIHQQTLNHHQAFNHQQTNIPTNQHVTNHQQTNNQVTNNHQQQPNSNNQQYIHQQPIHNNQQFIQHSTNQPTHNNQQFIHKQPTNQPSNNHQQLKNVQPTAHSQQFGQRQPIHHANPQLFHQLSSEFLQKNVQQEQHNEEHLKNLYTAQNLLPQGGELIQSLPKYEQHLIFDPKSGQQIESLPFNSNQEQRNQVQYFGTTERSDVYSSSSRVYQHSTPAPTTSTTTTPTTTTTSTTPAAPSTTTKDPKVLEAQLPDEVPEDLRAQLLSSGILNNADISILDYDKVGDIPLSALPPDQLANFYNAGGSQQLAEAGSENVPQIVRKPTDHFEEEDIHEAEASERQEVRVEPEVKVVQYNPDSDKGQQIQEAYVSEDAKHVEPVVLNDNSYNRYLPLKVNGTQFPIPDVPELKGKKITSVVVLAPVTYDFSSKRNTRDTKTDEIDLIEQEELKVLLADPSMENFAKFLDSQNKTATVKQSVILLVTGANVGESNEKEIFMYDVATKTVSKLSGELSSAFVDAAEANSPHDKAVSASDIVETRVTLDGNVVTDEDLEKSA